METRKRKIDLEENQDESTPAEAMDLDSEAVEAEEAAVATANEPATENAFDHFNDRTFFEPDEDGENYDDFCRDKNKQKLQRMTLEAFFKHVKEQHESKGVTPSETFATFSLVGPAMSKAMTDYNAWLNKNALSKTEQASDALEVDTAGAGIPAEATAKDPETAFDHFNDLALFFPVKRSDDVNKAELEATLATGHYQMFCLHSNKTELQKLTLDEFFAKAKMKGRTDMEVDNFFRSYSLVGKALTKAHVRYSKWQGNDIEIQRMVDVDYEISSQPLSHTYDLERLKAAIKDVFNWYPDEEKKPSKKKPSKQKVGPYLCFVQSSGMGKTKLMYEYRQDSFKEESDVASCLILPSNIPTLHPDIFDSRPDFRGAITIGKDVPKATEGIYRILDKILTDTLKKNLETRKANQAEKSGNETLSAETLDTMQNRDKIVLMFDESQTLLKRDLEYDAFLFRCVRVWLREQRGSQKVVAVFAGTNSKITNFLLESDIQFEPGAEASRGLHGKEKNYFKKGSSQLYPPFYHTATMGSCRREPVTGPTEYDRATNYGRPLFAILAKEGTLHEKISTVLSRMLIVPKERIDWYNELMAAINFLGTRVQMDDTSFAVISNLVAMAYANLSGCSEDCTTVKLAYLPDPVCARLAMCMMDEDFTHDPSTEWKEKIEGDEKTVKGKEKTWWAGKIREIFSTGMVRPAKGDFGEVVVALYMLFCGDLLRKTISDAAKSENKDSLEYSHFSVSLDAWLDLLSSGGRSSVDTKVPDSESKDGSSMSVGFIQVCRNSIRSYKHSWASLGDQCFLTHIYESGVGFYVFEGCDLIDMVVPLRINRKDAKDEFIPMVVSIKSEWTFPQAHATAACEAMTKRATDSRLTKVLCLLIVFGSKAGSHRFKRDVVIAPPATGNGRRVSQQVALTSADADQKPVSQQVTSTSSATRKSPRVSQKHASTSPDADQKSVSQQVTSTSSATRKSPRVSQQHASTSPDTDQKPVSQQVASTSSATRKSPRVSQKHASTSPDTDQTPASQQDASHLPAADEILPMSKLLEKYGIVAKAIRVPNNDVFGLTDAFRDMTPDSQVNSELFSSHSFLMAHRKGKKKYLKAQNALCASSGETSKKKYDGLFNAMKTPAKSSSLQG
jgi:hypothetical protein